MTEAFDRIRPVRIEEEMRGSYLDYAMSVIVARALPDVRDGLKPVHRRILYAMDELGLQPNRPFKKSARIVGEVLGKYHPHGDAPVYDSLVRMAQNFSMRYPLVDGQGNFGSVDNDPPAAMRYTEARLAGIAQEMLTDIERDTVDFALNFDDSLREPMVLPARIPNLLINGSSGIAVGMATNIPPHNLVEVCDAIVYLIENPEATVSELSEIVRGPDFPTGGTILGREGILQAYASGKGRVVVQAKAHIEETARSGRYQIIVTELPFQVNKAAMVERVADLVREKKLEGISDLRDESDRQGMRVVFELKREAQPRQVLNSLYKHTALQSTFFMNMLALVDGQPKVLGLKELVQHFVDFRRTVIRRRSEFDLKKAKDRAHILEGLKIAVDNMDAVIRTIRGSQTVETARTNLMQQFTLTEIQSNAILDMQLRRLTLLERNKIEEELAEVLQNIAYLEDLLANPVKIDFLIKEESADLKKKYGNSRRSVINAEEATELTAEDLVPHQEVVVTLSQRGYIKRVPSETYRRQHRGGLGIQAMTMREKDAPYRLLVADTHDDLLVFTDKGKVYRLRCWDVPEGTRQSRGVPLVHLVSLMQDEQVTEIVRVENFENSDFMVMATRLGEVKKTPLKAFIQVRSNGLVAMNLEPGDALIAAKPVPEDGEVIMVTAGAQSARFAVKQLRAASRQSGGVRGIRLDPGDTLVAMDVVIENADLLVVSEMGFGKRTPLSEWQTKNRGIGGVLAMRLTDRNGPVVTARVVLPLQDIMVISASGDMLRTVVDSVSRIGRGTQGVTIKRVEPGDPIVAVTVFNGMVAMGASQNALPPSEDSEQAPDDASGTQGTGRGRRRTQVEPVEGQAVMELLTPDEEPEDAGDMEPDLGIEDEDLDGDEPEDAS